MDDGNLLFFLIVLQYVLNGGETFDRSDWTVILLLVTITLIMSLSARDKSIVCIALALSIVSHVNDTTISVDDQHEAGKGPSMRGTATVAAGRLNDSKGVVDQHGSGSAATLDTAIHRCISSSRMQLLSVVGTDNHNQSRPSEFYASTLINMLLLLETSIGRCDESTQMISDALLRHLLTLPHGGQQLQHVFSYMADLLVERSIILLDSGVSPYAFRAKLKSFYDSAFTTMTMTMTTMTDRSDDYLSLQYDMLDVVIQAVQRIALTYSDAYELLRHYIVYEHMGFLLRLLKDKCALVVHTMIDISAREATATDPAASLLHQESERPSNSSSSTNSSSNSSSLLLRFDDWLSKTLGNACIAPSHCH